MNLYNSLGQIHEQHLSEAQSLETRLKYCILYRGAFLEGQERALMHLVELVCLRYNGRKGIVDEYDHLAHLMASLSNWLFEHFPLQNKTQNNLLGLLSRRQWVDASKLLPIGIKSVFEHAPIFGNARQMSFWKNELLNHLEDTGEYKSLFTCDTEGEKLSKEMWWLERLALSALFSIEPLFDFALKAKRFYAQQSNPSYFDKIALFILTNEPFFDLVRSYYCRPETLWFPVHLQLILEDDLLDEVMVIRYAQHLTESAGKDCFLLFDYLLRCKKHGEQIAHILTAFLAINTQTDREGLLNRIATLNLPGLHEQLRLSWESYHNLNK